MSKKIKHTGLRLTKDEFEWLKKRVDKGEFASISHGIRRCIDRCIDLDKEKDFE